MGAEPHLLTDPPSVDLIPTSTSQSKRLALLRGPDRCWKPPLVYALSYPGRFDVARLELTLRLVARRHSGLRSYFLPDQSIDVAACLPPEEADWPLSVVAGPAGEAARAEAAAAYAWLARDFGPYDRPLIRALLLSRGEDDVLGLAIEHSLLDAYSARVLLEDLAYIYDALETQPAPALDTLESDAVRFAHEERRWMGGHEGAAALSWWDRQTAGRGAYPRLDLPETGPLDPQALAIDSVVRLAAADVTRLRRRAAELRLSSFMLAAAATAVSLRERASTDDVAFLFACTRRLWPSTTKLVAYVANRSQLRVTVSPDDSVASLALRVRAAAIEAVRHSMLSHEQYLRTRFPARYERQVCVPYLHLNVVEQRPLPRIGGRACTLVSVPPRPGAYHPHALSVGLELHAEGTGTLITSHPEGIYDPGLVDHLTGRIAHHLVAGPAAP